MYRVILPLDLLDMFPRRFNVFDRFKSLKH
jgi:hypothetical protein